MNKRYPGDRHRVNHVQREMHAQEYARPSYLQRHDGHQARRCWKTCAILSTRVPSVIAGEGRVSGIGDPCVPTAQHEWSGVLPQDGDQLIQADSAHRNGERLDGNVTLP